MSDDYYNCQKCDGTGREHPYLGTSPHCDWCHGSGVNHHMQGELHRMCVVTLNTVDILATYKDRNRETRSMHIHVPSDCCMTEAEALWRTGLFKHLEMNGPFTGCWGIDKTPSGRTTR